FLGQNPSNSLESPGHQIFPIDLRDVKADLERLGGLRIRVRNSGNLNSLSQSHAKFLTQFASKRDFRRFALLDFAARKLPLQCRSVVPPPLPDQHSPVLPLNHRRHDHHHLSANLRALCVAPLSFSCISFVTSVLRPLCP